MSKQYKYITQKKSVFVSLNKVKYSLKFNFEFNSIKNWIGACARAYLDIFVRRGQQVICCTHNTKIAWGFSLSIPLILLFNIHLN